VKKIDRSVLASVVKGSPDEVVPVIVIGMNLSYF
jgi:hypothetical protein